MSLSPVHIYHVISKPGEKIMLGFMDGNTRLERPRMTAMDNIDRLTRLTLYQAVKEAQNRRR